MFLGRPAGGHLLRFQVDDGHFGITPKAHVETMTPVVQATGVRENAEVIQFAFDSFAWPCDGFKSRPCRRQGDVDDFSLPQIDFGNALAVQVRDAERFCGRIQNQSRWNANVLDVAQADLAMIGEDSVLEMEAMDQFFAGAAAEQERTVAGKRDSVESF